MTDYSKFFDYCSEFGLQKFIRGFQLLTEKKLDPGSSSDLPAWLKILNQLPDLKPEFIDLNSAAVTVGRPHNLSHQETDDLKNLLMKLNPWRKGPFNLFGIFIDTEWRSDLKWQRLENHIQPLKDRLILDIGCGSGYHVFRMAGQQAKLVMGIEPYIKSVIQFHAVNHFIQQDSYSVVPLGIEDLPDSAEIFDTVFSMGLLSHRRSPIGHLNKLRSLLRNSGELVLETLVIDGALHEALVPPGRYAKMRNVWFIPSVLTLESWLKRCGFKHIRLIDITKTTNQEQRRTEWMTFESLADFLDPDNPGLTIEGLPAPKRAIFLAEAP